MKKVKGYIFSRPFMGERAPQHVQNIVIRDYCNRNSLEYLLSASEYRMKGSYLILKDLISNLHKMDGIIAYSLFQMPSNQSDRNKILRKIIMKKKIIYFAVEQIYISNIQQLKQINSMWQIKKTLLSCPTKI